MNVRKIKKWYCNADLSFPLVIACLGILLVVTGFGN